MAVYVDHSTGRLCALHSGIRGTPLTRCPCLPVLSLILSPRPWKLFTAALYNVCVQVHGDPCTPLRAAATAACACGRPAIRGRDRTRSNVIDFDVRLSNSLCVWTELRKRQTAAGSSSSRTDTDRLVCFARAHAATQCVR